MSTPVVWVLALASTVLLIAGGFTMAVARFRGRVAAQRRQAARLGAQLEGRPADPFGELAVIKGQLHKIGQRLGKAEEVAGLPVQSAPGSATAAAPEGGAPVTQELEQDLDLFKKELFVKARRIEEISTEKQVLAEKVVELESLLATAPAASTHTSKPSESNTDLVDVLQQEADELRNQIAQRDQLLKSLEKSDTSGLVKEVGRIRQELMGRNEELNTLKTRLATTARQQHNQSRLEGLEREKEELAARALDAAAQLRVATQRIGELEQILMSRQAAPEARPVQATSAPETTSSPPAPPRVPMPQPPKQPPPPPQSAAGPRKPPPPPAPPTTPRSPGFPDEPTVKTAPPRPPRSPGFPDEPTLRTAPPQMDPTRKLAPPLPAKKRRHTDSIFPPPNSKKDLLD
jgi:hypothetical protein